MVYKKPMLDFPCTACARIPVALFALLASNFTDSLAGCSAGSFAVQRS